MATPQKPRRRPNVFDDVVLPQMASRGGQACFARLSPAEKHAVVTRLNVGAIRATARKRGHPEPVIVLAVVRPSATDDTPEVVRYAPLPIEYGGTGEWPKGLDPASLADSPPPLVGLPKKRSPG